MKNIKRVLSMLMVLMMLVGIIPMTGITSSAALEAYSTHIATYTITTSESDVYYLPNKNSSAATNISVKSDFTPSPITSKYYGNFVIKVFGTKNQNATLNNLSAELYTDSGTLVTFGLAGVPGYSVGEIMKEILTNLYRPGYEQGGWYSFAGVGLSTSDLPGQGVVAAYTNGGSFTIVPQWEECSHSYSWSTITSATCTTAGSQKGTCTKCGSTTTSTIAALGHNWGSWSTTTAPTCVAKGVQTRSCSRCSTKETKEIAVDTNNHSFGAWVNSGSGFQIYRCTRNSPSQCYSYNAKRFTVTYNANGGTAGSATTQTVEYSTTSNTTTFNTAANVVPTPPAGKSFVGWSTSNTATTGATSFTAGANMTLYAVYGNEVYDLVLNAGGGTFSDGKTTKTIKISYGQTYYDAMGGTFPYPTRDGYVFQYFDYNNGQFGLTENNWATEPYGLYSGATMTAIWEEAATPVDITFYDNDGTGNSSVASYNAGETFGELPALTRDGYVLEGWYDQEHGGTLYTEDSIVPETPLALYARWSIEQNDTPPDDVTVFQFHQNGGHIHDYAEYVNGNGVHLHDPWIENTGGLDDKWNLGQPAGQGGVYEVTHPYLYYAHMWTMQAPYYYRDNYKIDATGTQLVPIDPNADNFGEYNHANWNIIYSSFNLISRPDHIFLGYDVYIDDGDDVFDSGDTKLTAMNMKGKEDLANQKTVGEGYFPDFDGDGYFDYTDYSSQYYTGNGNDAGTQTIMPASFVNEHVHFVARWREGKLNVTFDHNGGTFNGQESKTYQIGSGAYYANEMAPDTLPTPVKDGAVFAGSYSVWTGDPGKSTKIFSLTANNFNNAVCTFGQDVTFYADYEYCNFTETIKAATCTEPGLITRVCDHTAPGHANHNYTETEVIDALGHDYKATVTPPTCTAEGYTTYKCERCGDTYVGDNKNANGHKDGTPVQEKYVAATCTTPGSYEMATYCTVCGTQTNRTYHTIEALQHDYDVVVTDPTCTDQGYTTYTCKRGDDSYVDNYTNALGHDWGAWETVTAPTCTENGLERRDCTRCDAYETNVLTATDHNYEAEVTDATCTDDGYTTYTCTNCGDTYVVEGEGALGHDMSDFVTTVEPGCTTPGEETSTCSRCDYTETNELSALDHDYEAVVTDPTCTDDGYTTHTCTRCGYSYTDNETSALDHDWNEGEVTTDPTCTDKGEKTYTCNRCGETYTEEVEALDHDYEAVVTPPTCTADGYTTYTCSRCGDSHTDDTVSKEGHDLGEWYTVTEATCTEDGLERCDCSKCDYYETRVVEALDHDYVYHDYQDPTCTEPGWEPYESCSRCDYTNYSEIPALDHDMGEWGIYKDATCTETGIERKPCVRDGCEYYEERVIPAKDHNYVLIGQHPIVDCEEDVIGVYECTNCQDKIEKAIPGTAQPHDPGEMIKFNVVDATCTEDGHYDYVIECNRCGLEIEVGYDVIIPATDHDFSGEWYVAVDPTCEGVGEMRTDCLNGCGEYSSEEIAPIDHAWDEGVQTTDPTCTEPGVITYTCLNDASHTYTEEVEAPGHTIVEVEEKAPTCTEAGHTAYEYCTVCDYTTFEEIASTGHTEVEIPAVEPTCTETGLTAGVKCSVCEEILTEQEVVDALDHDMGEWYVTKEATYFEAGEKRSDCSRCEYFETEEIPQLVDNVDPTVTLTEADNDVTDTVVDYDKDGVKVEINAVDNESGVDTVTYVVTKDGIAGESTVYDEESGVVLTKDGEYTVTATVTDKVGNETVVTSDLIIIDTVAPVIAPTVVDDYSDVVVNVSDKYLDAVTVNGEAAELDENGNITLPKTEDGNKTYTVVATDKAGNETTYTVTVVDDDTAPTVTLTTSAEENVNDYNPDYMNDNVIEVIIGASDNETGVKEITYIIKDAEGNVVEEGIYDDANRPTLDKEGVYTITASAVDNDGNSASVSTGSTITVDRTAPVFNGVADGGKYCGGSVSFSIEETYLAGLYTESDSNVLRGDNAYTYTGNANGRVYTRTAKDLAGNETTVVFTVYTHNYTSEITKAPTCTDVGERTYTCQNDFCGHTYTEEVEANGHVEGEAVVENNVEPTCTENGSYDLVVKCTVCGDELDRETVTVDALDHDVVIDEAVAPKCEETGLTEGSHCDRCGEVLVAQEVVDATGHAYEVTEHKDATCTEDGYDVYTCKNDASHTYTTELTATGHTEGEAVVENNVEPTCTENGSYDLVVKCTVCGDELERETVTVDALDHDVVIDEAVAPKCEETGLTEGSHCDRCGEVLVAQEVVDATGHAYEVTEHKDATCTEDGYDVYTCKNDASH
ncbi:MAG: hypothetical protein E7591_07540, partial [Ruminococcaceae bacterium]|nr:hypothetical protein [Oscillospiraceae bacterium]